MAHTLLEEIETFKAFLNRKRLSAETIKQYLIYMENLIELLNETGMELNQITIDAFLDVYPHAVGRAFLKNYLEFKERRDLYIIKVTGRVPKKETIVISPNEVELIREALYDHDERFGLILDISINCALRRQEVLNIKAKDISIKEEDKMFILIHGKGNRERNVYVSKDIATLIIHYCFNNNLKPSDYLFRSKMHPEKSVDHTQWNKAFRIASWDACKKKYHPHQLRHTRATDWYNKGLDIVSIKQRLGHSNIATTMLYINPDSKKELEKWSNEE